MGKVFGLFLFTKKKMLHRLGGDTDPSPVISIE